MRPSILILILCVAGGCVTEGGPAAPAKRAEGPGPVAKAEATVAGHVARLPNLYGTRLLQVMQEIIAYKRLALRPVTDVIAGADIRTQANLLYILGFIKGDQAHRAILPFLRAKDAGVRFEASVALLNLGDWGGVPTLLDFMASKDRRHRFKASEALKGVVKKDFGYQFDASPPEREKALAQWRGWWTGRRNTLIYGPEASKTVSSPVN